MSPGPTTIQRGDRFRAMRDISLPVLIVSVAPAHTGGGEPSELPAGTVIVALDPAPAATSVAAYPENYEELETALVAPAELAASDYSAYYLAVAFDRLANDFERIAPLDPRPDKGLPQRETPA